MQTISGGKHDSRMAEGFDQNYLSMKDPLTSNSKQSMGTADKEVARINKTIH